jgi:hypothetical protein
MLVFDTTVLVGRTPQVVFDFVARDFFTNLPKFNPDVREMKKLTDGPVGVGSRCRRFAASGTRVLSK